MAAIPVTITSTGRMSLPAPLRKRLGLQDGGTVFAEETEHGIVLRTTAQTIARAQALACQFRDAPDSSVDDFLRARSDEAGE